MTLAVFGVPGDLASPTGGYSYARRLLALLPAEGIDIRHLALPGSYPDPTGADLAETARLVAETSQDAVLLLDGLAYGAMTEELVTGFRHPVVALVHHPLGFESGLSPERRTALLATEAAALSHAARIVVTSPLTARLLTSDFNVDSSRIAVAMPGADAAPRAKGSGFPLHLLAVGAVSPRKGYMVLVSALAALGSLDWRLTIAGAVDRDPAASARLRTAVAQSGVGDRITLAGAVGAEELARLYATADVFVSPSLFEGYGMVLAEALACGLPLVASTGGAAAETVPDAAALKVPPGDEAALAAALRRVIGDAPLRRSLADASWAAGQLLPRWSDTAATVAQVLKEARA